MIRERDNFVDNHRGMFLWSLCWHRQKFGMIPWWAISVELKHIKLLGAPPKP